ncbi:MAG TPA: phenylalanine--tRNA ligase subunit beta [Streptosporangiaceae bacterium]|jgi:phenylalanyl-tRNA synthetase beta chain|nr:phenylalanine--tRNA ligase subunit beta [Streptosporangiaceae bacterium]
MRLPLSWLLEYAAIELSPDDDAGIQEMSARLTGCGLEVESVEPAGQDITGVVVAEVLAIEELTGFNKPIRYCQVSTGDGQERHVICGASNFAVGDRVPLALPGAVLPGGFEIGARKTYGRISEGMICSAAELAIGDDHSGIIVLSPDAPLGTDFVSYAGLRDVVFDINVTPDKGFALSVRGVARELAISYQVPYTDPADVGLLADVGVVSPDVYPVGVEDTTACDRFVVREVRGLDPATPTPLGMKIRLARAGQRSVSLPVDVTNYLMLELGQPLHAFDRSRLTGPIVVRRAKPGERLETIDHVVRALDPEDILITDSSGPISLAGTMGGVDTEVSETSRDLVIEAAHFSPRGIARMSRRHKLGSEASARFERGVDPELPVRASARAATMLAALSGGTVVPGCSMAGVNIEPVAIAMAADYPDQVAGLVYGLDTVLARLREVGCSIVQAPEPASGDAAAAPAAGESAASLDAPIGLAGGHHASRHAHHDHGRHDRSIVMLLVTPPSWRPDLTDPADLAEEVIRLEGYQNIPVQAVRAAGGRGLTGRQRLERTISRTLAYHGFVEVLSSPFTSAADFDKLQLPADDARRRAVRLANPISDDDPLMRTTLLPGMLRTLARNLGLGFSDVALYEFGHVFSPRPDAAPTAPILRVDRGPAVHELALLEAALPDQPLRVGAVLTGDIELPGYWGKGRPAGWQDAIEAARDVLRTSRLRFDVRADQHEPWHPGRCAAIFVQTEQGHEWLAGYAGELHPRVIAAFGLPARTAAMELDMSVVEAAADAIGPVQAPALSTYPPAVQDVALVVPQVVPAADVARALADGVAEAGDVMLESLHLFDVYTGDQAGEGRKSLAYTLRFRAPDRTLTAEEANAARDAAVAEAARRTGAVLRSAR